MDPYTVAMTAVQLAKLGTTLAQMVEGELTAEQKQAIRQAVADANRLWEDAGQPE